MTACRTDIDWSTKPEPWRWIGPRLRMDCENIAKGGLPKPKPFERTARQMEGSVLRERRLALGLTRENVADKAGYAQHAVSNAEKGEGSPVAVQTIEEALTQLEAGHR